MPEEQLQQLRKILADMQKLTRQPSFSWRSQAAGIGLLWTVEALAPSGEAGDLAAEITRLYRELTWEREEGRG